MVEEKTEKDVKEKPKKNRMNKMLVQGAYFILVFLFGVIMTAAVFQPVAPAYADKCHAIDTNLSVANSNLEIQKAYYYQLLDREKALENQTVYMTNKNFEFGNLICKQKDAGIYYPSLDVPTGKIKCFGTLNGIVEYDVQ